MLNLCGWNGLVDDIALPARQGMKTNFENQENESRGVWSTTQSRLNELTTYWWLILGKTGIGQIGAVKRGLSSNPQRQKGEGENSTYWLSWKILDIDKVSWEVSDLTCRVNNWVKTPIQVSHGCWRWEHSRFWPNLHCKQRFVTPLMGGRISKINRMSRGGYDLTPKVGRWCSDMNFN